MAFSPNEAQIYMLMQDSMDDDGQDYIESLCRYTIDSNNLECVEIWYPDTLPYFDFTFFFWSEIADVVVFDDYLALPNIPDGRYYDSDSNSNFYVYLFDLNSDPDLEDLDIETFLFSSQGNIDTIYESYDDYYYSPSVCMTKMDNWTFFIGMDLRYSSSPDAFTGFVLDAYNT